ncbi:MAG: hypothetical protein L0229_27870 [Blastocatellia bacterium]|nr:hypothetical protein [Blastocatellia bacterium]
MVSRFKTFILPARSIAHRRDNSQPARAVAKYLGAHASSVLDLRYYRFSRKLVSPQGMQAGCLRSQERLFSLSSYFATALHNPPTRLLAPFKK